MNSSKSNTAPLEPEAIYVDWSDGARGPNGLWWQIASYGNGPFIAIRSSPSLANDFADYKLVHPKGGYTVINGIWLQVQAVVRPKHA